MPPVYSFAKDEDESLQTGGFLKYMGNQWVSLDKSVKMVVITIGLD